MSSPLTAERTEWQYARMPQLSYRNTVPQQKDEEDSAQTTVLPSSSTTSKVVPAGRSIKEIREAIAESQGYSLPLQQPQPTAPVTQATKSKRSLFGSLFQKEPTISAFEQYGQSMIAQHGSLSPKNIPNVSAERMPADVPKVNSKWDGVPDYVRMREEEEREAAKARNRRSKRTSSNARDVDLYEERLSGQRRNSNTTSTTESWDCYSMKSRPYFQDNVSLRPESIYSSSSGGSAPSANRPTWEKAYSYTSSTGPKSSDNSLQHYKDTASTPKGLNGLHSSQSISTQYSSYSDQSRPDVPPFVMAPAIDAIPEYTSSPVTTPVERSPQTPSPFSENESGLDGLLRNGTKLPAAGSIYGNSTLSSRHSSSKRVSRAGMGSRTNSNVAPWESQMPPAERLTNSQTAPPPTSPRGKLRLFGRDKK